MTQTLLRTIAFLALYMATAAILARSAVTWASTAGPTDKAATLAFIALSVLIPLVGVGAMITVIYLRFRGQGLRYAHLITFYVVLVGELIVLLADSDRPGLLLCWDCERALAWARLILPGSLFMLVAPLFVKGHYDVFGQS